MQIKTNLWDFHDLLSICIYSYTYNSNVFSTYVEYVSNKENEKLFLSNFSFFPIDDIHSKNLKFIQIRNETVILICILDLKLIQVLKCHLSPINDEKMLKSFHLDYCQREKFCNIRCNLKHRKLLYHLTFQPL